MIEDTSRALCVAGSIAFGTVAATLLVVACVVPRFGRAWAAPYWWLFTCFAALALKKALGLVWAEVDRDTNGESPVALVGASIVLAAGACGITGALKLLLCILGISSGLGAQKHEELRAAADRILARVK